MRTILFFTLSLFLLLPLASVGQQEGVTEDTIIPRPAITRFLASLDSLQGDTAFVLDSPKGYVILPRDSYIGAQIALKSKNGYLVFGATNDVNPWKTYSFELIDFNGKGDKELLVKWQHGNGRGGWIDGWSETSSGLVIWDLDRVQILFEFQDSYNYEFWSNGVVFDSTGEMMLDTEGNVVTIDSLASDETSCENYSVDISLKKIFIQAYSGCSSMGEIIYVYEEEKDGLVLQH